jgi:putative transposase
MPLRRNASKAQNRSLESVYPIVDFDAIVVKVRHEGRVINKAIHLALGVNLLGTKELLGMWMTQNESARILASGADPIAESGAEGCFHRLLRWAYRFSRCD